MSDPSRRQSYPGKKLLILIFLFLFINTSLIVLGYYLVYERMTRTDFLLGYKQELARDILDYSYRMATDLNVHDFPEVREALAEYNYSIDLSAGSDELIQVILGQGRRLQDIILDAADRKLKDMVLEAVNSDLTVQERVDKAHLYIRIAGNQVTVLPDELLDSNTMQRINNIFAGTDYHGNQNIDIEIENGRAKLVLPQTPEDQLKALTDDLNLTRMKMHEIRVNAGLAEMVGPGITLNVYDAEAAGSSSALVHDADIRDLVNELFSAGARGISVGGERLIISSAIRCSGPLIMVNYRQISTNPVVIEAVGEPELLISGLGIIIKEMENRRGLKFELQHAGFIKLPAYANRE